MKINEIITDKSLVYLLDKNSIVTNHRSAHCNEEKKKKNHKKRDYENGSSLIMTEGELSARWLMKRIILSGLVQFDLDRGSK
jgi:hypothetical protein